MSDNLTIENGANLEPKKIMTRDKKRLIFYILVVALPILHFALFYVYVNLDMFLMAFRKYTLNEGIGYTSHWVFFGEGNNFAKVFEILARPENQNLTYQTFLFYFMSLTFVPIGLLFSYYVYKNYLFSGFFRLMLYLPHILSGIIMTMLYKYMFSFVFGIEMKLWGIVLYSFIMGFGGNVIMYVSAMCGIDTSISESCQLDGAGALREFWSITLPMVFPTVITFLVLGVAGIFTNQAHLYTFYGKDATTLGDNFQTFGYFIYVQNLTTDMVGEGSAMASKTYAQMSYPQLCALGVMITLVVLPFTFGLRYLLERFGPSEN